MTKKYVLLNIETGGRQRAHEFVIDFNGSFADIVRHYAFAIFVAPSTNSSSIRRNQVHVSHFSSSSSNNKKVMRYNVGNSIHGEFINGVSWLKTTNVDKLLLLTGSNDTSVGLSIFANDTTSKVKTKSIKALYDLPPHESCVRAVSTSRYIDHHSLISTSNEIIPLLLVTCGGKLSMSFYRVEEIDGVISVYYLCSNHYLSQFFANKKSNKKTDSFDIDHRINAAKAVPSQLNPYIHYVFSGDSDGKLELFILNISNEDEDESGHTNFAKSGKNKHILQNLKIGKEIELTQRPILCLDVLLQSFGASQQQSLFCFVGNTAGEVCVWIFHVNLVSNNEKKQSRNNTGLSDHFDLVVSNNNKDDKPSLIYKAHQVGTNGISATFLNSSALYDDTTDVDIIVCSGGDDQALTTAILRQKQQKDNTLELLKLVRYDGASSSAIKAVKLMNQNEGKDNDFLRLYSVGYDQRLSLWKVNPNVETNTRQAQEKNKDIKRMLQFLCSSFVHVSDISSLDCIQQEEKEYCVVAGEGLEVFSLDLASLKAAQALAGANYLLITAGAGFSADSGLGLYEDMPKEYRDFCNPSKLVENPQQFQTFWLNFSKSYMSTLPHYGYNIIDNWCIGNGHDRAKGKLKNLCWGSILERNMNENEIEDENLLSSPYWVYSSNVDGHFRLFDAFASGQLCEIHGTSLEFRCACVIGYKDGMQQRLGNIWDKWNNQVKKQNQQECSSTIYKINSGNISSILRKTSDNEIFKCSFCDLPLRPNVLMFHDTDVNVLKSIDRKRELYQRWEAKVEEQVEKSGKSLVIIELGCGKNVPAVRPR
eukprot:CAMPEP_0178976602 /NCGR_PEP_ID=MMETSP0789-20121207/23938_1 /TAXON_ID=3005 /ORGANISM="Rhizosolenia setigera, Strain CCMP 1694" /LENGTH=817 /DNA_ID=CAMNT_0020665735 /DNA_START=189 /DNA_END=2643 /DNA_ORIENTATION=+